jgi:hypothetical protein
MPWARQADAQSKAMNEIEISDGITSLFRSAQVKELHLDRFGKDPLELMRELQGDITAENTLADPGKWGIGDHQAEKD